MKTLLLAGTMLLGLTTAAVPALAQDAAPAASGANLLNGYVGAAYGRTEGEVEIEGFDSTDGEADLWKLEGSVNIPAGADWGVQLDADYLNVEADDVEGDVWSGTAHLYRSGPTGAMGVFGGLSDGEDSEFWSVGAEALAYFDQLTLEGQLGYGSSDDLDSADVYAARGQARWFASDNLRFDVTGGFTRLAVDDFGDLDIVSYGVGAEYQLAAAPVSLTAAIERSEFDDFGIDADDTTFMVGARYTFGGSLRDRDRSGARFSSSSKLFGGSVGTSALALIGGIDEDEDGGEGNDTLN